jgi:dihydroflavonol-4-reductase
MSPSTARLRVPSASPPLVRLSDTQFEAASTRALPHSLSTKTRVIAAQLCTFQVGLSGSDASDPHVHRNDLECAMFRRMRAVITGASGLVGANLAEALLREGHHVVGTRRPSSHVDHLSHLKIEWTLAPLSDPDAMTRAFSGADVVFHCAAAVEILPRVTKTLYETNVIGTDHVLKAVRAAKVSRLVHCSSVAAASISDGTRDVTEEDPWNFREHGLADGYATTKHESQERVLAAAKQDVDAVVVQPTYMFGPYDIKPTSGQMIIDIASGRISVNTPGTQNIVDVRDVARGMILAWQKGVRGEKYILGCENVTYGELFARIADELRVPPPRVTLPFPMVFALGTLVEFGSALLHRPSELSRSTARYAYCRGYRFSSDKAKRELGYAPSSPQAAIRLCIEWLREHGTLE